MIFKRLLTDKLLELATKYPVITLTGPRQSGKTTLCRACFPGKAYVNLEAPDTRDFALTDPRGFLNRFPDGAIIDEIQRAPQLVSYIQVLVDELKSNGRYILTGSEQFRVSTTIAQSLAGRTAILRLLPLSLEELKQQGTFPSIDSLLLQGGYPRLYEQALAPGDMYRDYVETYIERDIRQVVAIKDLSLYRKFVQLCAGRIGQPLNLTSLGNDVGVSHTTIREWISILEASYIAFLLPPYFANISKRLMKSPKLYFYDVGVATHLLKIRDVNSLLYHPLRGNLFENFVVSEILKAFFNRGLTEDLYFYRETSGTEVDLMVGMGAGKYRLVEIKAGETVDASFFRNLKKVDGILSAARHSSSLIYGGSESYVRNGIDVLSWRELGNRIFGD
jgi:predicted AAA+ superfamily ATPase